VFAQAGFGNDTIRPGFDANPSGGQDLLDISGLGINAGNFAASVQITAVGADTSVDIGADHVLLQGVAAAAITSTDFLLA